MPTFWLFLMQNIDLPFFWGHKKKLAYIIHGEIVHLFFISIRTTFGFPCSNTIVYGLGTVFSACTYCSQLIFWRDVMFFHYDFHYTSCMTTLFIVWPYDILGRLRGSPFIIPVNILDCRRFHVTTNILYIQVSMYLYELMLNIFNVSICHSFSSLWPLYTLLCIYPNFDNAV